MSVSGISTDASYLTPLFNTTSDPGSTTPDFAADFEAIDSNATGVITKTEFEQAFATLPWPDSLKADGADAIFAQLDPSSTGRVQHADFVTGMTALAEAPTATDVNQSSADATASSGGLSGISTLFATLPSPSTTSQAATDEAAAPAAVAAMPSADAQAALQQTLEAAYAAIDTSNAGYITAPQLAQAFSSLTLPDSIEALGYGGILAKLDPNYTGQISHSDFVSGLANLASAAGAPVAASSASASMSSTGADNASALTQFYTNVFASIAPGGADSINADDLAIGFDQLQLPASLSAMTPNDLDARLDPFSTGEVSRADFVGHMVDLVAAANAQDDAEAAAAAQQSDDDDFAAMLATIDTSSGGSITRRQLEAAFDNLQLDPAIAGLGPDVIFSMLDANASGSVSPADFVDGVNALGGAVKYLRNVAGSIDSDGNGLITPEEFSRAFNSLQLPASLKALGATAVYGQIDPFYTNQVSIGGLVNGLTNLVAQSGLPVDAAATTSSTSSGDLILSNFYRGGVTS